MPAIIVEDVTFNHTSIASTALPSATTIFSLPLPSAPSVTNETDDYWTRHLSLDDIMYWESAPSFVGANDDQDDDFGSPMPFDASENGLWNGRFVPPPPRPPFLNEESIFADGITTCDLCSWARPTKSTFSFDGTIEKASELGWPFALIIVSVLSAIIGAILMITIVRYKRKNSSNRNETNAVQWWPRSKHRPHTQSTRRNNIYTGNPSDSIRGLHHPNLHHNSHHHLQLGMNYTNNNNHGNELCNWRNAASLGNS